MDVAAHESVAEGRVGLVFQHVTRARSNCASRQQSRTAQVINEFGGKSPGTASRVIRIRESPSHLAVGPNGQIGGCKGRCRRVDRRSCTHLKRSRKIGRQPGCRPHRVEIRIVDIDWLRLREAEYRSCVLDEKVRRERYRGLVRGDTGLVHTLKATGTRDKQAYSERLRHGDFGGPFHPFDGGRYYSEVGFAGGEANSEHCKLGRTHRPPPEVRDPDYLP